MDRDAGLGNGTLRIDELLERLLAAPSPWIHRITLEPGMGLLCNNVLHDRSAFTDDPARPRLIYRARYHDRIDASG